VSPHQRARVTFGSGSRTVIASLALLLLVPAAASLFTDHAARSDWEKRPLTDWQSVVDADGLKARFARLEDYIDDHIGFALALNRVYRRAQFHVFGDSPVANIDLAEDGFLFLNSHARDNPHAVFRKLCQPDPHWAMETRVQLQDIARFAAERGIRTTLAVIPSKTLLYADRLPATVPAELRLACREKNPLHTVAGALAAEPPDGLFRVYFPFGELAAMRDREAFFPPGNFHANSMINHEFTRGLLQHLGIEPGDGYSRGARLGEIQSDLKMLGFPRRVRAWEYRYPHYRLRHQRGQPEWVRDYYARAHDFSLYTAARPASQRRAVVFSNSIGAFLAQHLAPGFAELYHVNLNHLAPEEARGFIAAVLDRVRPTDLLFLFHDSGLPSRPLQYLATGLSARP
jgi:hypothetical protein